MRFSASIALAASSNARVDLLALIGGRQSREAFDRARQVGDRVELREQVGLARASSRLDASARLEVITTAPGRVELS